MIMNNVRYCPLPLLALLVITGSVNAQSNGNRIGFGVDQGLGITGSIANLNLFIGDDGLAADYIFKRDKLKIEIPGAVKWYIGVGVYHEWDKDDETGVRLPVGVEWYFVDRLDVYLQLAPKLGYKDNDGRGKDNDRLDFGVDAAIGIRYSF